MTIQGETLHQYCLRERPHDDLASLYNVLSAQFDVWPDLPITPEIITILENLPK